MGASSEANPEEEEEGEEEGPSVGVLINKGVRSSQSLERRWCGAAMRRSNTKIAVTSLLLAAIDSTFARVKSVEFISSVSFSCHPPRYHGAAVERNGRGYGIGIGNAQTNEAGGEETRRKWRMRQTLRQR